MRGTVPKRSQSLGLFLAMVAATAVRFAAAATITDLGSSSLPPESSFIPIGVNSKGMVVGDITTDSDTADSHAAIWADGVLTRLPERPGTLLSDAVAINESGRIAGLEYHDSNNVHAVFWDGITTPVQIGPLISTDIDFSQAEDVDAAGGVVGSTLGNSPHFETGYYRSAAGSSVLVGLGNLDADRGSSFVGAITADGKTMLGKVTGTLTADGFYLWSTANPAGPGIPLDITPDTNGFVILGGSVYNSLLVQNDLASDGAVFGFKGTGSGKTWWLRTPDGTETQIVGLVAHNAINAAHTVAGTVLDPRDVVHAAIWDSRTHAVTDLNTLLPADSGFILTDALGMDDLGDIVGIAAHDGIQVGFLMKLDGVTASIAPTPPNPIAGTDFTLTVTVRNGTASPLMNVTPPAEPTVSGAGKVTLKDGPTPASVASLDPNGTAVFTYTYEADEPGSILITADIQATANDGPVTVSARCGLGSSAGPGTGVTNAVGDAPAATCPASGKGTTVQIAPCSIQITSVDPQAFTDSSGKPILYDTYVLVRGGSDSAAPAGHSYSKPGGT